MKAPQTKNNNKKQHIPTYLGHIGVVVAPECKGQIQSDIVECVARFHRAQDAISDGGEGVTTVVLGAKYHLRTLLGEELQKAVTPGYECGIAPVVLLKRLLELLA